MNSMNLYILWSKKIVSSLIMLTMLFNIIMFTCVQSIDVEFESSQQVNIVDTITKYYTIISNIPISIVSKFLATNVADESIAASNKTNTNKESNKSNKVNDCNFIDNISLLQQSVQLSSVNLIFNKCSTIINNLKMYGVFICSQTINTILFSGSMILARGDTEENIYYNKYGKLNRLV